MGDRGEWVGLRVRVYWEDDDEWFSGIVQDVDEDQRAFVLYDDGDERWEDETQQMEIVPVARSAAAPAMMEPPASPGYEDEYEDEDTEKDAMADALDDDVHGLERQEFDPYDRTENASDLEADLDAGQATGLDHELGDRTDDEEADEPSDHEDSQSIAMSDAPLMFDKRSSQPGPSVTQLPIRGVLRGLVLRASNLSGADQSDRPNTFVRIAFVEASDTNNTNLMLRCKNALAATSVVSRSSHPIWNEDDNDDSDGAFELQLAPPIFASEQRSSWFQLRGDLLFKVYSSSSSGPNRNDFIGQTLLSLQNILREVLVASPSVTRYLALQSRQGKPLAGSGSSDLEPPELVVSFSFLPTYEQDLKQKNSSAPPANPRKSSTMASVRSAGTRKAPVASRDPPEHIRRLNAHRSSSSINRRKFEKQVEQDNRAFAKKLQGNQVRQGRKFAQAKAEEKQRKVVPQRGTMMYSHKASSHVNRSRFQSQVNMENKAIEKRLHAIVRNSESKTCWNAQAKHDNGGAEDQDPDMAYVRDKRQRKQAEKDFMMEKAQTKYQQQNQVVEMVLALQQSIADQKAQIFAARTSATRLGILNKKDQHLRDCLRNAVDKAATATKPVVSISKKTKQSSSADTAAGDVDFANGSIRRERKELELLLKEEAALKSDLTQCSQELAAITREEKSLEQEVADLQSKLRFVQSKQRFQQRLSGKDAHILEREMKSKQRLMELSREQEDQWALFQAHQELTQLQITVQVLTDRLEGKTSAKRQGTGSTSTALNEYLAKKIEKNKAKLAELQRELSEWQDKYAALVVSGDQERLRKQIQELQHVLFLCQTRAKQAKAAEQQARVAADRVATKFQAQLFHEQTETEILLKKKS